MKKRLFVPLIFAMLLIALNSTSVLADTVQDGDTYSDYAKIKLSNYYLRTTSNLPSVTALNSQGDLLVENTDYELTYDDNPLSLGNHTIIVDGIGDYDFHKTASYSVISEQSLGGTTSSSTGAVYYKKDADTKTLYIFGSGSMPDFSSSAPGFCKTVNDSIYLKGINTILVDEGVTTIGKNLISGSYNVGSSNDWFPNIETIIVPESVTEIYEKGLSKRVESVYIYSKDAVIASKSISASTIYGYPGSTAEEYANNSSIQFVPLCEHNVVLSNRLEPACNSEGYSGDYVCGVCNELLQEGHTLEALSHSFTEWQTTTPSTCEGAGLEKRSCKLCGLVESNELEPNGHSWGDFVVDVPATCTENGSKSIHCENCDSKKDVESIPALQHEYGDWKIKEESTCLDNGTIQKTCGRCGFVIEETIQAKGHDWNAPSYVWSSDNKTVTATRTCKNDPSHKETEIVKTTSAVTKKATYTAMGQTTYTATFTNAVFKTHTKTLTNIPKLPKKANTLTVKTKTNTIKFNNLKKKNQVITVKKAFTVSKAQGKVTYKKASGNAKIVINSAGKVTVKKGLKKGTYKVKVKVTAAGNTTYKAGTKTVTVTIKVK